ncbi:hypothetical protein HXX76_000401 [Chlamydomonas incerta]|uniref:Uncharacterized protein n=1 Tax=Chlamydomonas incerta TaxID=51695 RepID=A0A835WE75_CHLIN|nr:hypothetical protein HXX76_000401 [Chlamydomonas incerta]|eukprot:KAG2445797.1 hypothetical protein HXX76_000401 [Chlamydomonas incerta]
MATVQQWRKQQGLKEGDVASRGGHGGGVGPAAGLLRPAAHTPPHDTDAGHAHDQQPTYGGGTSAFTASKGWWSAWLPSAPLQWSTPPVQPQPLPPQQPPTPGSAGTSPSNEVAVAAVAATASHAASTAPTAERRAVGGGGGGAALCAVPRPRLYVAIVGSYAACVKHALDLGLELEPAMAVVGKAVASIRGSSALPAYMEQARQSMPGAAPEQVADESRRLHLVAAGSKTLKQLSGFLHRQSGALQGAHRRREGGRPPKLR